MVGVRDCDKCGEAFVKTGRYEKLCPECWQKAVRNRGYASCKSQGISTKRSRGEE